MKYVFIDTEFTGEHAFTTLVSVGLVTLTGEQLYITLNDYDKTQVTNWLKKNVLNKIDQKKSVSKKKAYLEISSFLESYSQNEEICLVSAGKTHDMILLFQLFHQNSKNNKFFHSLHDLPDYLNHNKHLDLNTMFSLAGIKIGNKEQCQYSCRDQYADIELKKENHNALYDARIVKECFLKLVENSILKGLIHFES